MDDAAIEERFVKVAEINRDRDLKVVEVNRDYEITVALIHAAQDLGGITEDRGAEFEGFADARTKALKFLAGWWDRKSVSLSMPEFSRADR